MPSKTFRSIKYTTPTTQKLYLTPLNNDYRERSSKRKTHIKRERKGYNDGRMIAEAVKFGDTFTSINNLEPIYSSVNIRNPHHRSNHKVWKDTNFAEFHHKKKTSPNKLSFSTRLRPSTSVTTTKRTNKKFEKYSRNFKDNQYKKFVVGVSQLQGRRPYMEDRYIIEEDMLRHLENKFKDVLLPADLYDILPNMSVMGVFDGHAGSSVADYVRDHCKRTIIDALCQETLLYLRNTGDHHVHDDDKRNRSNDFVIRALHRMTDILEESVLEESRRRKWKSGSCMNISVIVNETIYISNVGDCRAVALFQNGKTMPLSVDQKPDRPDESSRIIRAGGSVRNCFGVWRVFPGRIAVARSFGDLPIKNMGKHFIADCEITSTPLQLVETLVIASDGIWDVISNSEAIKIVQRFPSVRMGSKYLVDRALAKGSGDNLTALVINFKHQHTQR